MQFYYLYVERLKDPANAVLLGKIEDILENDIFMKGQEQPDGLVEALEALKKAGELDVYEALKKELDL